MRNLKNYIILLAVIFSVPLVITHCAIDPISAGEMKPAMLWL